MFLDYVLCLYLMLVSYACALVVAKELIYAAASSLRAIACS